MLDFLLPRCCVSCGKRLTADEKYVCCDCLRSLPRTNYHLMEVSPLEQLFWGQVPVARATALFFYDNISAHKILHGLKYHNVPALGRYVARILADEIAESGFFDGVDVIVPVPLAWKKRLYRGYNQCEWIAQGISQQTGLPVVLDAVSRVKNNQTQTSLSHHMRWENVEDIFRLRHPERIRGKHVLVVDDVITTGATTVSCMKELLKAGDVRFSVISLAKAGIKEINEPLGTLL